MNDFVGYYWLGGAALVVALPSIKRRLELSRAKHRSLAGHSRWSKRIAAHLPKYTFDENNFFSTDGAPDAVAKIRRAAFHNLAVLFEHRFSRSRALTKKAESAISDLQFTGEYRVPFQYNRYVQEHLSYGSFIEKSSGVSLTDLDGNQFLDLTGSYGVNVFGIDFYKDCINEGARRVADLGPVLGSYHPIVESNVHQLRRISGLDEVSFHMSGTEAVMQAVRLARYHTRRDHLVRFCGAYHGWWEDVQPGIGNPVAPHETFTLKEVDTDTIRVLRNRTDIACVLVNPLQALHPNRNAPSDSALINSQRSAVFDRTGYTRWLHELRSVCTERGIVLIFDEVFVGFRLAPDGAQEYFGVRADLVTYGKTLGGGLPIGVVCGRADLMRRFRPDRPVDVCFARGTFNSHPYVMGAMQVFLERLEFAPWRALYENLDALWDQRAQRLNERLRAAGIPVQVSNLSTIWTVNYIRPSRYNWMLQYYLRAHGLALSWVGTGRLIFSINYTESEFNQVADRFTAAAKQMCADGWWWSNPQLTNKAINRLVMKEMLASRLRLRRPAGQLAPADSSVGVASGV